MKEAHLAVIMNSEWLGDGHSKLLVQVSDSIVEHTCGNGGCCVWSNWLHLT